MMTRELLCIVLGYLSGSILFARLAAKLTGKEGLFDISPNHNPGTANTFQYGGFLCGMTALLGDLGKGFLPVYLYLSSGGDFDSFTLLKPLVLAAPVLGHAFPIFCHFQGGKGIAVSFGCLLGLFPLLEPAAALACTYIFFSTVLRVNPHSCRTFVAFTSALMLMLFRTQPPAILLGFAVMLMIVMFRHQTFRRRRFSTEPCSEWSVKLLWMDTLSFFNLPSRFPASFVNYTSLLV